MPDPIEMILCESVVLSKTGLPAVKISIGDISIIVPAQDARNFAVNLLGAAEGAETDSFFFSSGMPEDLAVSLVRLRREHREKQ